MATLYIGLSMNTLSLYAQKSTFTYEAYALGVFNSSGTTPFYQLSNQHGKLQAKGNQAMLGAKIKHDLTPSSDFSWGYGAQLFGSLGDKNQGYLQELYAHARFHWIKLEVGAKEQLNSLRENSLSSGSFIWSGNARPIPQATLGLDRFRAIPFTQNWVEIFGSVSYGYFMDTPWLEDHFNYTNSFITTNVWYHHKQLYFRSKANKPFRFTLGIEMGTQFGGTKTKFHQGEHVYTQKTKLHFKDFIRVLIPQEGSANSAMGDQNYYMGNHLGTWHLQGEINLPKGHVIKPYTEWMFDDGSGISKLNGFDGLWGIEYQGKNNRYISAVVFEYLHTLNQGGPIHFAPWDHEGNQITSAATGADDYYNNYYYNGWSHFGQANGNPLIISPVYNDNGYLRFMHTRVQAFHLALAGQLFPWCEYQLKYGHIRGLGTYYIPLNEQNNHLVNLDLHFTHKHFPTWNLNTAVGCDLGSLIGNNWGIQLKISKTGIL